jgi:hypothetical protein
MRFSGAQRTVADGSCADTKELVAGSRLGRSGRALHGQLSVTGVDLDRSRPTFRFIARTNAAPG